MKKITRNVAMIAIVALSAATMLSCNDTEKKDAAPAKAKTEAGKQSSNLPNYRYVDLDTILSRYNLAKDYSEEINRLEDNFNSQYKQHQTKLMNLATNIENKRQNNGYLSDASFQQDQQDLMTMQDKAQRNMQNLQNNLDRAKFEAQKTLNDSIVAFIQEYNKTRGYDAILFKAATLYINPELDITNEVVEGLNARYNKVKK